MIYQDHAVDTCAGRVPGPHKKAIKDQQYNLLRRFHELRRGSISAVLFISDSNKTKFLETWCFIWIYEWNLRFFACTEYTLNVIHEIHKHMEIVVSCPKNMIYKPHSLRLVLGNRKRVHNRDFFNRQTLQHYDWQTYKSLSIFSSQIFH